MDNIIKTIEMYLKGYRRKKIEGLYRKAIEQLGINISQVRLWDKDDSTVITKSGRSVEMESQAFYAPIDRIDEVLLEIYKEKLAKLITGK